MSNKKYQVIIPDFIVDELEPEKRILGDLADVTALGALREEELVGRIEQADAIILFHDVWITRQTIERLEHCRLIARAGVGYDNIDFRFARERGIPVVNVPDYGSEEVADTAIGMMLALTRGIHVMNSRCREKRGPWGYQQVAPIARLRGRPFGVVGLGRIGTAVALRAKTLGMDVLFYDPYKPDGYDKALGVRRVESLDELLAQSMVVSLHCPHTEETRHMINAATIARMPRGSYLINTARVAGRPTPGPCPTAGLRAFGRRSDRRVAHEPPADDHPLWSPG